MKATEKIAELERELAQKDALISAMKAPRKPGRPVMRAAWIDDIERLAVGEDVTIRTDRTWQGSKSHIRKQLPEMSFRVKTLSEGQFLVKRLA